MNKEQKNAYSRTYYAKNKKKLIAEQKVRTESTTTPEQRKAYRKAYYEANKGRLLEAQRIRNRENYQANPEPYRDRGKKARFAMYGMTQNDFQDMLDAQGGGCAICTASSRVRTMAIDHDHVTGKVRGILCRQCNTALGLLGDTPERIMEAADYLTRSFSGAT